MTTGYQWAKKAKTHQLRDEIAKRGRKRNKFHAVKVKLDGYTFDSKAEAKRYGELKLLEMAYKIKSLVVHPKYLLTVNGQLIAAYKPDFQYQSLECEFDGNQGRQWWKWHIEDVKSPPTAKKRDFILIRKLMKAIHGIDVEVISSRSRTASDPRAEAA